MNIGFIGQWNESGHSYVTKTFVDALTEAHNCFVLASTGVKDGVVETEGIWASYNVTPLNCGYGEIREHIEDVKEWIERNNIELVFFNEMYDWGLVAQVRELGCKTATYVDWFCESWVPMFKEMYDFLIISAEHVFDIFINHKNAHFVPWGVKTDLFEPQEDRECLFFHNAGWGGINYRKGTPDAVKALERAKGTMYLHTQTPVFDDATVNAVKRLRGDRLKMKVGSVSHPGLYHKGRVYVGPSKLEGLGLYYPEALASGLPIIATDAMPMKQWVTEDTGWLVEVERERNREDGYYFPEKIVNREHLEQVMRKVDRTPRYKLKEMSRNAREYAEQYHSFEQFKEKVNAIVEKYA